MRWAGKTAPSLPSLLWKVTDRQKFHTVTFGCPVIMAQKFSDVHHNGSCGVLDEFRMICTLWSFSIAMLNYQRVKIDLPSTFELMFRLIGGPGQASLFVESFNSKR